MPGFLSSYTGKTGFQTTQDEAMFLADLEKIRESSLAQVDENTSIEDRLASLERLVSNLQVIQTTINNDIIVNGGGGGSGGSITLEVAGGPFQVGSLVHYSGASVSLATAQDASLRANYIVTASQGGTLTLSPLQVDTNVLETSSNDDGTGVLYLYTNGGVTRNVSDIINTDGSPVTGFEILQYVGFFNGLSGTVAPSGFLRGSIMFNPVLRIG